MPERMSSPKRTLEHLGIRVLIKEIGLDPLAIRYTENGQPLYPGHEISFSHCYPKVSVMISSQPCGVDIQISDEKVHRIAKRFMNEHEFSFYQNDPSLAFSLWSAKEAIYKKYPDAHLHFAPHICLKQIIEDRLTFHVTLPQGEIIENCFLTRIDKHVVACTIQE